METPSLHNDRAQRGMWNRPTLGENEHSQFRESDSEGEDDEEHEVRGVTKAGCHRSVNVASGAVRADGRLGEVTTEFLKISRLWLQTGMTVHLGKNCDIECRMK